MPRAAQLLAITLLAAAAWGNDDIPFPAGVYVNALDGTDGFNVEGMNRADRLGHAVASAGDLNNDGIPDLALGAPHPHYQAGAVHIVFGAPGLGASGSLELAALDADNGLTIHGIDIRNETGHAVSCAGDLNADGIDDLILGAPHATTPADMYGTNSGQAHVIFGRDVATQGPFPQTINLAELGPPIGFTINGPRSGANAGFCVARAGDLNHDSIDDVAIGAPGVSRDTGEVYVLFGAPEIGATGTLDLATLDPAAGLVIRGAAEQDRCGAAVSSAGDLNADGIDDLAIGAPEARPNGEDSGQAYVVFGKDTATRGPFNPSLSLVALNGITGFTINGANPGDGAGSCVAAAPDINADAIGELIIGAPTALRDTGEAYVILGRRTGPANHFPRLLEISRLDAQSGLTLRGSEEDDFFGVSVATAGDLNHDGLDDLIIGAPGASYSGDAYVIYAGPHLHDRSLFHIAELDRASGVILRSSRTSYTTGNAVAAAGDVNDDGIDDVLVGAPFSGFSFTGQAHIVFGRSGNDGNPTPPCPCPGDITGDCDTDTTDFLYFAHTFGTSRGDPDFFNNADFNHDGTINVLDFAVFAPDFGCTDTRP